MARGLAAFLLLVTLPGLAGCGDDPADAPPRWQHARIEGLAGATGVAVVGGDLVFVAGGDDRDIRTVSRAALHDGGTARARVLSTMIRPDAPIHGSTPFAFQGYELEDLWKVPVDFQGVAFQPPDFLYLAERNRRLVFWGRVRRDAAGALASVKLAHVAIAPGADRSRSGEGDWRDQGPGLRGLAAVARSARQEDLWLVDEGAADAPLRVRRMDRYSTNLQGVRVEHGLDAAPDVRGVAFDGARVLLLYGAGRGRIAALPEPPAGRLDVVPALEGTPGPAVEGVTGWTGMAHAEDGTLFLVSGDEPAVVAWRRAD